MQHVSRSSFSRQAQRHGLSIFCREDPRMWPKISLFESRRWKLTSILEPPLDCEVLEKPCTLILLEDKWLYSKSWNKTFEIDIPRQHGMSYASLTVDSQQNFDSMINELQEDLSPIPDAVLVTRGPVASWAACHYLESLPLLGLVMIDALQWDHSDNNSKLLKELQDIVKNNSSETSNAVDEMVDLSMVEQLTSRQLKLEPNAVSMMVLQSIDHPLLKEGCKQVADRHSDIDGPFGQVVTTQVLEDDPDGIMTLIDDWLVSTAM